MIMKTKRMIAFALAVLFAVSLLTACGNKKLYSKDGVDIISVEVVHVDKAYNFTVTAANNNDDIVKFDFTKFEIKDVNDNVLPAKTDVHILGANQPYVRFAFRMEGTEDLKVGDTVYVYYDSELIAKITAIEL